MCTQNFFTGRNATAHLRSANTNYIYFPATYITTSLTLIFTHHLGLYVYLTWVQQHECSLLLVEVPVVRPLADVALEVPAADVEHLVLPALQLAVGLVPVVLHPRGVPHGGEAADAERGAHHAGAADDKKQRLELVALLQGRPRAALKNSFFAGCD